MGKLVLASRKYQDSLLLPILQLKSGKEKNTRETITDFSEININNEMLT